MMHAGGPIGTSSLFIICGQGIGLSPAEMTRSELPEHVLLLRDPMKTLRPIIMNILATYLLTLLGELH